MIGSAEPGPVNLGNPEEFTIAELAKLVVETTASSSPVEYRPLPADDPARRRPDITKARTRLGWQPEVPTAGIARMTEWLRTRAAAQPT